MGKAQRKLEKQVERKRRVRKKILARRAAIRAEAKKSKEREALEQAVAKADRKAADSKNYSPGLQKTLKLLEELKKDKDGTDSVVLPNETLTLKRVSKDTDSSEDETF